MATSSRIGYIDLDGMIQEELSGSSAAGPSKDANAAIARTSGSLPENIGPQKRFQRPQPLLAAPQAVMTPQIAPAIGSSSSGPSSVIAGFAGSSSNTETYEKSSKRTRAPQMQELKVAITPRALEEHSIYPVNYRLQKIPVPEKSVDPELRTDSDKRNFHSMVRQDIRRLWDEKVSQMSSLPGPATATSEKTGQPDQVTGHQIDTEDSDRQTTPGEKTKNTRRVLHESMGGDLEWDPEDLDRDFTMFDDTPGDQSLVPETGEWTLPPWDQEEPPHTPSLTTLASMTEWDPELDIDFQIDAEWNLEKWSDFRFKIPQTPSDVTSVQQALEITRMDFWIRNPNELYPDHLSQFGGESYGSQHRRLQHAFCRLWQELDMTDPPELYRLPSWMFGFGNCYWKPAIWGSSPWDERWNTYIEGIAQMSSEKSEKGWQSLDYRSWKARLEDLLTPSTTLPGNYPPPPTPAAVPR